MPLKIGPRLWKKSQVDMKVIHNGPIIIFLVSLLLHIGFFNINAAEWGDSYRILRASEFVREFSYPADEKRPPLFSVLLALRPSFVDQVTWGRLEMLIVSAGVFYVFYLYLKSIFKQDHHKINLGLLLLTLNPVYFYWSLRIMADVVFSLFVLLHLYLLRRKRSHSMYLLLGVVTGLAILTRFEGYLLFGAGLCGVLFFSGVEKFNVGYALARLKMSWKYLLLYVTSTLVTLVPWIMFRNPFTSSYFDEPSSRVYDLNTVIIYVLSLLFLFGFTSFFPIIMSQKEDTYKFLKSNVTFSVFLILELLLILAWPAAIPRLFVAVIPLFIILFVPASDSALSMSVKEANKFLALNAVVLIIFVIGQYLYKLQSLVLIKPLFFVVVALNFLGLVFLYSNYYKNSYINRTLGRVHSLGITNRWKQLYLSTITASMCVWLVATIWIHKDLYRTIKDASLYLMATAEGNVAHNDVGSVTEWYLDYAKDDNIQAFYYDIHDKKLTYDVLVENKVDYILATNEHNLGFSITVEKRPYLTQIYETNANINGALFNTKVYKFERRL